jgi:hypothetical protein
MLLACSIVPPSALSDRKTCCSETSTVEIWPYWNTISAAACRYRWSVRVMKKLVTLYIHSFFLEKEQQTDKYDGAECKEIHYRNERHPDPKPLFHIGCLFKEVRIAGYVFLGNSIADNEKEEESKHA